MPATPAHCGRNVEHHAAGGGKGTARNPLTAIVIAFGVFRQRSLPPDPDPKKERPTTEWTCVIGVLGTVEFDSLKGVEA